ncbi:hypothetical protein BpHYR1_036965 [Brachionus plicatilis]|uniref:Uncharacterized protein n=1 Tax=Brachionus plicatilis TaxID=10195 RepID=A0A3M7Q0B8_BRAPC|nr:hypothetical protein BpHYR1_036965 [Brachionus plicatilis]
MSRASCSAAGPKPSEFKARKKSSSNYAMSLESKWSKDFAVVITILKLKEITNFNRVSCRARPQGFAMSLQVPETEKKNSCENGNGKINGDLENNGDINGELRRIGDINGDNNRRRRLERRKIPETPTETGKCTEPPDLTESLAENPNGAETLTQDPNRAETETEDQNREEK